MLNWVSNCWHLVPQKPATALHHAIRHLHRLAHQVGDAKTIVATACTAGFLGAVGPVSFAPPAMQGISVSQAVSQTDADGVGGIGTGRFPAFAPAQVSFNGTGAIGTEPSGGDSFITDLKNPVDLTTDLIKADTTAGLLDVYPTAPYPEAKTDMPSNLPVVQAVPEPSSLLIQLTSLLGLLGLGVLKRLG